VGGNIVCTGYREGVDDKSGVDDDILRVMGVRG